MELGQIAYLLSIILSCIQMGERAYKYWQEWRKKKTRQKKKRSGGKKKTPQETLK